MKERILFILHTSPPKHGAAKVGDFIKKSEKIKKEFNCKFISIKSSETIADIGKFNFKKIKYVFELYFNILFVLITFKPNKIYYTSSIRSIAFYRDILISTLWKIYSKFKHIEIFYHYHTKGVDEFVSKSKVNRFLTKFFIKNVNLILLSPLLKKDFDKVKVYKNIFFLPNGVEDPIKNIDFIDFVNEKYKKFSKIDVLYLSHLMPSKGYKEVLFLAKNFRKINFNFAGNFGSNKDKEFFFNFVKTNKLKNVIYHGFVTGKQKDLLFKKAFLYIYPTKNDAFPLSVLEALSYGVPVISTNEGSIPYILDNKSGIIVKDLRNLEKDFNRGLKSLINKDSALHCRKRFIENFTLEKFEKNLIEILKGKNG